MAEEEEHFPIQPNESNMSNTDVNQGNDSEVFLDSSSQLIVQATPSTSQEVIGEDFQDSVSQQNIPTANSSQDTISGVFLDSLSQHNVLITVSMSQDGTSERNVEITPSTSQRAIPEEFQDSISQQNIPTANSSQDTISGVFLDSLSQHNVLITDSMSQDGTSERNVQITPSTSQRAIPEDTDSRHIEVSSQDRISEDSEDFQDSTYQLNVENSSDSSLEGDMYAEAHSSLDFGNNFSQVRMIHNISTPASPTYIAEPNLVPEDRNSINGSQELYNRLDDSPEHMYHYRVEDSPEPMYYSGSTPASPTYVASRPVPEDRNSINGIQELHNRLDDSPEPMFHYRALTPELEDFDITLAATHSYLGLGLVPLGGRVLLEAGWIGLVPVLGHSGPVFPGETVPLTLMRTMDIEHMKKALQGNKLFGLLSPDGSWTRSSGYGSLCEVYEANEPSEGHGLSLNVKARATHRFRLTSNDRNTQNIRHYDTVMIREVEVLPEVCLGDPLYQTRLTSLDQHRGTRSGWIRNMESVMTSWPRFLYDMTDMYKIKETLHQFFKNKHDKMPEEPISLSFWVASNLPLNKRDGLSLLMVDEALLRLTMEAEIIARINTMCCCSCRSVITKLEYTIAMSSEGLHSNYTNQYGYLHDVITTSVATNVSDGSESSAEYSWFPGYAWTIIVCATCHSHVGWRFDSLRRNLRPSTFYGISRNYVQPLNSQDEPERRIIIQINQS